MSSLGSSSHLCSLALRLDSWRVWAAIPGFTPGGYLGLQPRRRVKILVALKHTKENERDTFPLMLITHHCVAAVEPLAHPLAFVKLLNLVNNNQTTLD